MRDHEKLKFLLERLVQGNRANYISRVWGIDRTHAVKKINGKAKLNYTDIPQFCAHFGLSLDAFYVADSPEELNELAEKGQLMRAKEPEVLARLYEALVKENGADENDLQDVKTLTRLLNDKVRSIRAKKTA